MTEEAHTTRPSGILKPAEREVLTDVDSERLAEACTAAGLELSTEEARAQQSFPGLERLPHTVITNVEVCDTDASSVERD